MSHLVVQHLHVYSYSFGPLSLATIPSFPFFGEGGGDEGVFGRKNKNWTKVGF